MSDKTGISWTDATWNPVIGCSRVSEGCRNCYAEVQAARIVRMGSASRSPYADVVKLVGGQPRWTGEVRMQAHKLSDPLNWRKPRRIFVNSMSDLFHEKLTNEQIAAVFGVMGACPQHTFQVLTKRAKRMREWFTWLEDHVEMYAQDWSGRECGVTIDSARDLSALEYLDETATAAVAGHFDACHLGLTTSKEIRWPLPNVWLGVSVENQDAADERIPELLRTPAAVRFLSCEPLLDEVSLLPWLDPSGACCGSFESCPDGGTQRCQSNAAWRYTNTDGSDPRIDWVIAGCESGPGARSCGVEWLRSLRDQCKEAGAAFFLKQATQPGSEAVGGPLITPGQGSKRKSGGVIELPYLDDVQHAAFPVAP